MKKYFNEENVTALVIVFVGVLAAMAVGPYIIGLLNSVKSKVTGTTAA